MAMALGRSRRVLLAFLPALALPFATGAAGKKFLRDGLLELRADGAGVVMVDDEAQAQVEKDVHLDDNGADDLLDDAGKWPMYLFFVTDCTAHQKWMAFNVFNSARRVGQTEPISWVRSGCKEGQGTEDLERAKHLYPNAGLMEVKGTEAANFNLGFGVPKSVASFLRHETTLSNRTILGLIEADFIFLSRLRLDDLEQQGMLMQGSSLHRKGVSLIGRGIGVAQHYLCCDSLGPPYLLSVPDWRKLSEHWSQMHAEDSGWGQDQEAFARSAREAGLSFNVFDHFMVSDQVPGEGWSLVQTAMRTPEGDVCSTKKFGLQPGLEHLPTFMHVVRPWTVDAHDGQGKWGFSKYQVPPGWGQPQKTEGVLECGMPLFAEPPDSLIQDHAEEAGKERAWAVCTILHGLNSMLLRYKEHRCPAGFNKAKALKMNVPLEWTNSLLQGADSGAPSGTDLDWMHDCATKPRC